MDVCDVGNDEWTEQVRIRDQGVVEYLHAAETRYHTDCRAHFLDPSNVTKAAAKCSQHEEEDTLMQHVIDLIMKNQSQLWNWVELYNLYTGN